MTADGIELTTGDTFTVVVDYIDKPQINSTSQKVCLESTISLSAVPEGGVWSGNGVEGNTFNALTAGLGEHTVVYTLNSMSDSIVFTVEESITTRSRVGIEYYRIGRVGRHCHRGTNGNRWREPVVSVCTRRSRVCLSARHLFIEQCIASGRLSAYRRGAHGICAHEELFALCHPRVGYRSNRD